MNEEILKKINAKDTINNKLKIIIETFIKFYGEEERKHIENVFNHIEIIPYCTPEEMDLMIENIELQELENNINKFIKKIKITKRILFRNRKRIQ